MFQLNVSSVNAYIWMLDDHAHAMQVKLCKANTRGVTPRSSSPHGAEMSMKGSKQCLEGGWIGVSSWCESLKHISYTDDD